MVYIANFFALGLVLILFLFLFDKKSRIKNMPTSSKVFAITLTLTVVNAAIDLTAGALLSMSEAPQWLGLLVKSIYHISSIVTTTFIAQYCFIKILTHTHNKSCMRRAHIALFMVLGIYAVAMICNLFTGMLFYFDENGVYSQGPLSWLGYALVGAQMVLVLLCYLKNKATAGETVHRALINLFSIMPAFIIIQLLLAHIMLNSIMLAFAETILFVAFNSQRYGVHHLTNLDNRHLFFDAVNHRIAKKEPFHIFLINLKQFRTINQKFGHAVGDEYLYQFAFALKKTLRNGQAFHMNGTVFAILLHYTNQDDADAQSGVLLDFLQHGIHFGEYHIKTKYIVSHYVSNGSETSSIDIYETMEYSIARGYETMQQYIQCNEDIHKMIHRRRYFRERLEKIDAEHGFEVWYQPVKSLESNRFCSMEALVRLREPDGSLVSPAEFIPFSEETGRINSITWFVLEQVCKDLAQNPELADISVSINLPMAQLTEKGFVPRFIGTVDQAGVNHSQISLEFTERTILENFSQTQNIMQELTDVGFRFYLDDFGIGYSNFNCLMQLPFQIIKIDASLIHNRGGAKANHAVVQSLTDIFHGLRLLVVAEGAETHDEVKELTKIGVDLIQGYVFARPMPKAALLEFYQKENASEKSIR